MKKITLFALILALALSLVACGTNANADAETTNAPETTAEVTEPEETPEPTEEPEETKTSGNSVTIVTDDGSSAKVSDQNDIRGGTNQEDAILLPMNTKLYGTSTEQELWYAFTTGQNKNATYLITTVNKKLDSNFVGMELYDKQGNKLGTTNAGNEGIVKTYSTDELEPNTVYYLRILSTYQNSYFYPSDEEIYFRLVIKEKDAPATGYGTADSLNEARGDVAALEGEINPGTNQDDAAFIPLNTKIAGTSTETGAWFAFTTGTTDGAYEFSTVNKTLNSNYVEVEIWDEYGNSLGEGHADNTGTVTSFSLDNLEHNTAYYVRIRSTYKNSYYYPSNEEIEYTFIINAPEEPEANTATIEQPSEQLVFEIPFELNSTQVMFVADQATFIDEAAAKEALKPVADAILAHPEASILIAGTTATDGAQESCVNLSNKRAEAVKNLLVSSFGVPENQIQTVGLGYAADPFVRGKDRIPEGDVNGQFVESEGAKNRRDWAR